MTCSLDDCHRKSEILFLFFLICLSHLHFLMFQVPWSIFNLVSVVSHVMFGASKAAKRHPISPRNPSVWPFERSFRPWGVLEDVQGLSGEDQRLRKTSHLPKEFFHLVYWCLEAYSGPFRSTSGSLPVDYRSSLRAHGNKSIDLVETRRMAVFAAQTDNQAHRKHQL